MNVEVSIVKDGHLLGMETLADPSEREVIGAIGRLMMLAKEGEATPPWPYEIHVHAVPKRSGSPTGKLDRPD
jgi:hypothetical protein